MSQSPILAAMGPVVEVLDALAIDYEIPFALCRKASEGTPHTLEEQSHLLRASHIKPWAVSTNREWRDVKNGLAAIVQCMVDKT